MLTYAKLGSYGRFGNQLFQIASTIGFAVGHKVTYGFPDWEYQKYFINPLPKLDRSDTIYSLKGYLQDYRNFENCKELITHYFTLKDVGLQLDPSTIFIHFRAYSDERVCHLHPEQSSDYYKNAISHFPNKNFIIFTDNIEKARKVIKIDCPYYSGNLIEDFYLMSHCAGGIISNSSFSWWAGWLSGGDIILPKNWFTPAAIYPRDGYYIKDWLAL